MPIPANEKLYSKISKQIKKKYPIHSAYRSGKIVQEYKKQFFKLYPKKQPYIGKKDKKQGLLRWFAEKWKSDTGKTRYTSKSSVYRPTKRITKNTPKTFSEIGNKQLKSAKRKKYKYGFVKRF